MTPLRRRVDRLPRAASLAIAVGLGVSALAVAILPLPGPPLYDGVLVIEPYRWLAPPPGASGSPEGATARVAVTEAQSPLLVIATPEQPPQAQVFAVPGDLTMPAGTTALLASIQPVEPTIPVTGGQLAGNVYRITVTTQSGAPIAIPTSSKITVILRAPDSTTSEATIERLGKSGWEDLHAQSQGSAGQFLAVVSAFGDFAVVLPGSASPGAPPSGPISGAAGASAAPPSPAASAEGGTSGGVPTISLIAGIAIALVFVGLLATAILPGRRRRTTDRGWTGRPPPRRRR